MDLRGRAAACLLTHALCFGAGGALVSLSAYTPYTFANIPGLENFAPAAPAPASVAGVVLWLAGTAAGPASVAHLLVALARELPARTAGAAALGLALAAAAFSACAAMLLLLPQRVFFTSPPPNVLWGLLGGLVAVAYIFPAAAAAAAGARILLDDRRHRFAAAAAAGAAKPGGGAAAYADADAEPPPGGEPASFVSSFAAPALPLSLLCPLPPATLPVLLQLPRQGASSFCMTAPLLSPRPSALSPRVTAPLLSPPAASRKAAAAALASTAPSHHSGALTFSSFFAPWRPVSPPASPPPLPRHQPDDYSAARRAVFGGLCLVALLAFLSALLPPLWAEPLFDYLRESDAGAANLVQPQVEWVAGPDPTSSEQAAGWVFPRVIPKLYLDEAVFFGAAAAWLLMGFVSQSCACGRALARRRACGRGDSAGCTFPRVAVGELLLLATVAGLLIFEGTYWAIIVPRIGAATDEEVASAQTAGGGGGAAGSSLAAARALAQLGAAARVAGRLTSLLVALTLLPAPASSVWEAALGVPFARALLYHRALGRAAWLAVTVHAALWWAKWAVEGSLAANAFALRNLATYTDAAGDGVHVDQFTIPLVEAAWLALTASIAIGLWLRRRPRWYAAFARAHAFAAHAFLLAALLHAASFWKLAALGLVLLACDRAARAACVAARPAKLLQLLSVRGAGGGGAAGGDCEDTFAPGGTTGAGVLVRLAVDASALGGDWGWHAGQWAWLTIPEISALERHPFTIASSPVTGAAEFWVRVGVAGSWTSRLAALAAAATPAALPAVLVDGPYGRAAVRYYECETLVIVAGGAGITAAHALLEDLLLREEVAATIAAEAAVRGAASADSSAAAGAEAEGAQTRRGRLAATAPVGRLRHIELLWSMRADAVAPALLAAATGTLLRAAARGADAACPGATSFAARLFCTSPACTPLPGSGAGAVPAAAEAVLQLFASARARPDIEAALRVAARRGPAACFVCGPRDMVDEATAACDSLRVALHCEAWQL